MSPLAPADLVELADAAEIAARAAGEIVRRASRFEKTVAHKTGGSSRASQVVTETDREAEDRIVEILSPSTRRFDLAMLAEESPDDGSRHERDAFWCIDPLDGTLFFTEDLPGPAVSIALVSREGRALVGIVFDVTTGETFRAIRGQGLVRDGRPWKTFQEPSRDEAGTLTFHFDRSFAGHPDEPRVLAGLERMARDLGCSGVRTAIRGGAVLNALRLLEAPPGCYFKFPRPQPGGGSLWDFAATACLLGEAGGVAWDWEGRDLDLNRRGSTFMNETGSVLATDPDLAREILRRFRGSRGGITPRG